MSFSRDSKQKLTAVAATVIVALLGINAFLLWNKFSNAKTIDQQAYELTESDRALEELDKKFNESLAELEDMRSNNEELNELIDEQTVKLTEQKNKIERMIRSGNSTKADLAEARSQIERFQFQIDEYLAENKKLMEEKQLLTQKTTKLTAENSNLSSQISQERTMNEELVTAKAALVSEKENLESQNRDLSTKVTRASVVNVAGIKITGEKIRKSGKAVSKKRAKDVDRLKVCFNPQENEVTEEGLEKFYVRIVNPVGETLAIENLGSGVMTTADGKNEIRFTKVKEIDYNRTGAMACFYWEPTTDFQKGNYEVEVYNKGYLAGKSTFKLK